MTDEPTNTLRIDGLRECERFLDEVYNKTVHLHVLMGTENFSVVITPCLDDQHCERRALTLGIVSAWLTNPTDDDQDLWS